MLSRQSKIFKVKSKGGSYKTNPHHTYYAFLKSDGLIFVFAPDLKQTEFIKVWENVEPRNAKKYFKMIGSPKDANQFKKLFDSKQFFNYKTRSYEYIYLFPTIMDVIQHEIDVMKTK